MADDGEEGGCVSASEMLGVVAREMGLAGDSGIEIISSFFDIAANWSYLELEIFS